jgi:CHAD domain-containing protein
MSFRLKPQKSVPRGLSRIVAGELIKALDEIGERSSAGPAEAVHEARKGVKKTRAVLRLFQKQLGDDYQDLNGRLRTVGHQLSSLRDVDATAEMLKCLRDRYAKLITGAAFRAVDRGLLARKRRTLSRLHPNRLLAVVARELEQCRKSIPTLIRRVARSRTMRGGITRGYRRARKAMTEVRTHPGDLLFHQWRRRVKDHWYQMRLLEGVNRRAHARVRQLKRLETWLGDDHNLVLLRDTILEAPTRFGDEQTTAVVLGCVSKYQVTLRRRALKGGHRLFARTPATFRKQIDQWWRQR